MADFQILLTDDRYRTPTLYIVEAATAARACEIAERMLAENAHHLAVEVYDDDGRIFVLEAGGTPGGAEPPSQPDA